MKKNLFVVFLFFSVLFFQGCSEKKPGFVRIAANLPLTGDLSTYGESVRDGMILAQEHIEAAKGHFPFKVDFVDNLGDNAKALSIYQNQLANGFDIYISGITPQTMTIIKRVERTEKPHFVWSWIPFITRDYKNTYRTYVHQETEALDFIDFVVKKNPGRIAIAQINMSAPQVQYDEIILPALNSKGFNEINREIFNIEQSDLKNIVAKINDYNPDVILMSGFKYHIISFISVAQSYNLIKDNVMISMDLLDAYQELDKSLIEGLYLSAPVFLWEREPAYADWENKFRVRFNRKPRYTDAYAYDMMNMLMDIAERSPEYDSINWDNEIVKSGHSGITGKLVFNSSGDLVPFVSICKIIDGQLVPFNEENEKEED